VSLALLVDVGSTWTKGVAVSLADGRLVARTQHPTTIAEGIMRGVHAVVDRLQSGAHGEVTFRAATSSAAGGLRVAAIGLVPALTGLAARQASLGAGARVVFSGSFVLAEEELQRLREARPDIVLLTGGTDGGNTEVIVRNARLLAQAKLAATIIVAGNKSARGEVRAILEEAGLDVRSADNVLPELHAMEVASAQAAIREVFLQRIVVARGIEELRAWTGGTLLPTPRAVLDATAFLAQAADGLGMLVVADIGGATTDVHSIGGEEPQGGTLQRGLREPHAKRTVEGDLGLRVSAVAATEALGTEALSRDLGAAPDELMVRARALSQATETLAQQEDFDRVLTVAAVAEALRRHAGWLEQSPLDRRAWFQVGKDLRDAQAVIASGGVFAARSDAHALLAAALDGARRSDRLVPTAPRLLVDQDYVLFAVGLLHEAHPEAARALALRSLADADGARLLA
jgi:uncharacterized protein (TIGR01319 family)